MLYKLERSVTLPTSLQAAWEFFSDPSNLQKITPPSLSLSVLGYQGEKMYPGQILHYRVRPFGNIPFLWVTEIAHVEPLRYFVDVQRIGPYRLWHHEHRFREVKDGVEVSDLVSYVLPLGALGRLLHSAFVKRRLEEIFLYREKALRKIFE